MAEGLGYEPLETVDPPGGYTTVTDPEQVASLLNDFSAEAQPGTTRVGSFPTPDEIAAMAPQHVSGGEAPTEDRQAPYRVIQVPDIEGPPNPVVRMPGGYLAPDETLEQEATVRELTGADEEAIAKASASGNFFNLAQAYLDAGVERIGDAPAIPDLTMSLTIGDRDFLLLNIRRATYGDIITFDDFRCPVCSEEYVVTYDLARDVPIKTLEHPERRFFDVPLRNNRTAICSIPNGYDQREVYALTQKLKKSPNEVMIAQNTILISRCVNYIRIGDDDNTTERMTYEAARALGSADRKAILKALMDSQPGPQYTEVKFECKECESVTPVPLGLGDLFRGE